MAVSKPKRCTRYRVWQVIHSMFCHVIDETSVYLRINIAKYPFPFI